MNSPQSLSRFLGRVGTLPCAALSLALGLALAVSSCSGSNGATGAAGQDGGQGTVTTLTQGDNLPGIHVVITSLTGGTAPAGRFRIRSP